MKKSDLKVMTIFGTRPEMIRLSRVMALMEQALHSVTVHTGQNFDQRLYDVFLRDLSFKKPDYYLGVDTSSIGRMLGGVLMGVEDAIVKEKPDALLILGDTNSAMAGLLASRYRIPLFHMEAGNRCFDRNVPEEGNRKIIDHIADFNLVYTEHARRNLLAEGFPSRRIILTGSPMNEVLAYYRPKINRSRVLSNLKLVSGKYHVASFHRAENIDNTDNLLSIIRTLNMLTERTRLPVLCTTHPRTRQAIDKLHGVEIAKGVTFYTPLAFTDYVALQKKARCVISDSGTVSEESAMLGFPAVIIRNAMERPEALDFGTVSLAGLESDSVLSSIEFAVEAHKKHHLMEVPVEYKVADTSWRVVRSIIAMSRLSRKWYGLD